MAARDARELVEVAALVCAVAIVRVVVVVVVMHHVTIWRDSNIPVSFPRCVVNNKVDHTFINIKLWL